MALTTKQISQIQVLLAQADMNDFDKIAEMFNTTRRMLERNIGSSFSIGQQVSWTSERRGLLSGTITKINSRNIVVNAGDNGMWKVSPGLLNAA